MLPDAYRATLAFEDAIAEARCDAVQRFEHGTVIRTPTFPIVYDLNRLHVRHPVGPVSAPDLIAAADRLQDGLGHRCVSVAGAGEPRAMSAAFGAAGWLEAPLITMALTGPLPAAPVAPAAVPVQLADLAEVRAASLRELPWGTAEVVRQIAAADDRVPEATDAAFFGVRDPSGRVVSGCHLYSDGRIAQVEDVATLPEHRGRGAARAAVIAAAAAALARGHDLVFIVADAGDWPRHFYRRLGFEPIGTRSTFTRVVEPA